MKLNSICRACLVVWMTSEVDYDVVGYILHRNQIEFFCYRNGCLFNGVGMVCKVEATSDATIFFSCIVPTLLFIMWHNMFLLISMSIKQNGWPSAKLKNILMIWAHPISSLSFSLQVPFKHNWFEVEEVWAIFCYAVF